MSRLYVGDLDRSLRQLPHLCPTPPAHPSRAGALPPRCPCERARAHALHLLAQAYRRGLGEADARKEQFQQYERWCREVLGDWGEAAVQPSLEDFYLYLLLGTSLGNFDNATPSLKHYLFSRLRHRLSDARACSAYLFGAPPTAGAEAVLGVPLSLNVILSSHMRLKNLMDRHGNPLYTKEDYFHYEDLEDLFRTPEIVRRQRAKSLDGEAEELCALARQTREASERVAREAARTKRYVPLTGLFALGDGCGAATPFQKTYRDRCGGFLNVKGWLSVLANFFLVGLAPYVVGLYLIAFAYAAAHQAASGPVALLAWGGAGVGLSVLLPGVARLLARWNRSGRSPPPVRLDAGVGRPRHLGPAYHFRLGAFLAGVWVVKLVYSYWVLTWIMEPVRKLLPAQVVWLRGDWSALALPYAALFLMMVPYLLFYFLDLFTFAYFAEAVVSFAAGRFKGLGRISRWRAWPGARFVPPLRGSVVEEFVRIERDLRAGPDGRTPLPSVLREYRKKFLPGELHLGPSQQDVAWARTWNLFMITLYEEHKLTPVEYGRLTYGLDEDAPGEAHFLNARLTHHPDVTVPPCNREVRRRVQFFLESLYMTMEPAPFWDRMLSLSSLTPIYEEEILFSWEDVTREENTGYSILGRLVAKFPDEWWNLLAELGREGLITPQEEAALGRAVAGRDVLAALGLGRADGRPEVRERIRWWAGLRGQEVARSVQGLVNKWRAWGLTARIHFPCAAALAESLELEGEPLHEYVARQLGLGPGGLKPEAAYELAVQMKVHEKVQLVLAHQPYTAPAFRPGGRQHHKRADLEALVRRFPFLQLAHLDWDESARRWASVLRQWEGTELAVLRRVELPCDPTYRPILGEGKPENQNHALKFVRGEIVNARDCNDGMRWEDALKEPNALQEFARDPELQILGFPEIIQTATHTWAGRLFAYADRSFAMLGQRFLALFQVRMHYGRDYLRMAGVRRLGGVSHPGYLNEDVFAGLLATLQGQRIKQIEFLQGLKGREMHFCTGAGLLSKFGAGAGQQAIGRVFHAFNTSPVVGILRGHLYFLACIGFYIRKRLVLWANLVVVTCVLFLGLSGYVAFPDEVLAGYWGVLASQASSILGYFQLLFDVPFLLALLQSVVLLPLLLVFYLPMTYVSADGFARGLRGRASYVQTGRGYVLEHLVPYLPHRLRVRRTRSGTQPREIDALCRHYPSLRRWAEPTLAVGAWAVILWQSPTMLWSALFLIMPLLAYLTPYYLTNHGATPLGVGPRRWAGLFLEDVSWWLRKLGWLLYEGFGRPWRVRFSRPWRARFARASPGGRCRLLAVLLRDLGVTAATICLVRGPVRLLEVLYLFAKGSFLFLVIASTALPLVPVAWVAHAVRSVVRRALKRRHARACQGQTFAKPGVAPAADCVSYPYSRMPGTLGLGEGFP